MKNIFLLSCCFVVFLSSRLAVAQDRLDEFQAFRKKLNAVKVDIAKAHELRTCVLDVPAPSIATFLQDKSYPCEFGEGRTDRCLLKHAINYINPLKIRSKADLLNFGTVVFYTAYLGTKEQKEVLRRLYYQVPKDIRTPEATEAFPTADERLKGYGRLDLFFALGEIDDILAYAKTVNGLQQIAIENLLRQERIDDAIKFLELSKDAKFSWRPERFKNTFGYKGQLRPLEAIVTALLSKDRWEEAQRLVMLTKGTSYEDLYIDALFATYARESSLPGMTDKFRAYCDSWVERANSLYKEYQAKVQEERTSDKRMTSRGDPTLLQYSQFMGKAGGLGCFAKYPELFDSAILEPAWTYEGPPNYLHWCATDNGSSDNPLYRQQQKRQADISYIREHPETPFSELFAMNRFALAEYCKQKNDRECISNAVALVKKEFEDFNPQVDQQALSNKTSSAVIAMLAAARRAIVFLQQYDQENIDNL